ncbi:Gfo/Idh/MocA family oxidoreductase, partial [Candidatus Poribacteria bacterium]
GNAQTALKILKDEIILGSLGYWMGGMPGVHWWRVRAESGGQHVEQTTHIFDICRYMVGSNAVLVHGVANSGGMTDVEDYDVDDISMVNIVFENGVVANITSACAMKGFGRVQLEVFCPGLVVTLGGSGPFINRGGEAEEVEMAPGLDRDRTFIDAVISGDDSKILSPYADALETHKITMAASKSFRTGKAVDV